MSKIALQMDPLASLAPAGDTSVALGLELQKRGHELFFYDPATLLWAGGQLSAPLARVRLYNKKRDFYELGPAKLRRLANMDCVMIRQDPPFDMAYITNLHLLETLANRPTNRVLFVNHPRGINAAPEKMLVLKLYDELKPFLPPSIVVRDKGELVRFRRRHKDIVLKPLHGNGGAAVFRITPQDENFHALVEQALAQTREPLLAQAYLPAVRRGDKRVMLVDGEAVGALNRIPRQDDMRANLHVGGMPRRAAPDATDRKLAAILRAHLQKMGILFAGMDVIGGKLTELNVTSPTGVREIKALGGPDVAALLVDAIERKLAG